MLVWEEVQEPYLFTAQDPVSGNEQKPCGFKRTPLRRSRILDEELDKLKQLGLSWEQACRLRLSIGLNPAERMFYAEQMAQQNKLEAQWEEDHKPGTYYRLDIFTGEQRKPYRRKDPRTPGCKIAEACRMAY